MKMGVAACICLGYPFHPSGKPADLRLEPVQKIETPTLILQGTLDTFCSDKKKSKDLRSPRR